MAFAGLLGTIFGNQAIRVGAFVVVIVFVVSVILLLLADRRHLQQNYGEAHELLTRYCDFVVENSSEPLVSIEAWDQVVYVQPNGDVDEVITIRAIALRRAGLLHSHDGGKSVGSASAISSQRQGHREKLDGQQQLVLDGS